MNIHSEVLERIAEAAVGIAAERERLDNAFAGLQASVTALDPTLVLNDDGTLSTRVIIPEPVEAPPSTAEQQIELQQELQEEAEIRQTEQEMAEAAAVAAEVVDAVINAQPVEVPVEKIVEDTGQTGMATEPLTETEAEQLDQEALAEQVQGEEARQQEVEHRKNAKEKVLDALEGTRRAVPALVNETGLAESTVRNALSELTHAGLVVKADGLRYMKTAPVRVKTTEPRPVTMQHDLPMEGKSAGEQVEVEDAVPPAAEATPPTPQPHGVSSKTDKIEPKGDISYVYFGSLEEFDRSVKTVETSTGPREMPQLHWTEKTSALKSEQERRDIWDWLVEHRQDKPYFSDDIAEALDIPRARVTSQLRNLVDRKLVKMHENYGYSKISQTMRDQGKMGGRPSHAYEVVPDTKYVDLDGNVEPQGVPLVERQKLIISSKEREKITDGGKAPRPPIIKEDVRDAAVELGEFNMQKLMDFMQAREMDRRHIVQFLAELVDDEQIRRTRIGWKYNKPTDPGKAFQQDQRLGRTGGGGTATAERPAAAPVAGTGKKLSAGEKEVQAMLDAGVRQLGPDKVRKTGSGHFAFEFPDGHIERIASTPNSAGLAKDKAKLRKAGLKGI